MKMKKIVECKKIAIIGGGASGMIAAVFAAKEAEKLGVPVEVTIYESNNRIGKKILVTGNGRCNFSNKNISVCNFHGDSDFAYKIYQNFNNETLCEFFRMLGVVPKCDAAGRIYPMSFQATSVLDALRAELQNNNVKLVCDTKVNSLKCHDRGFVLNNEFYADACVIATGGKASPVHGSDGSGYEILKNFNVSSEPVLPALSALICDNFPKGLKGIRAQGTITIKSGGKTLAQDSGELQYTDYGLSGIPSMQVSGNVSRALYNNDGPVFAVVDSCPAMTAEELKNHISGLIRHNPDIPGENLLSGILPKKLGISFLCDCSVNPNKNIGILHSSVIDKIVLAVKNKKYKIKSVKGFNDAQVSCGGIPCSEINNETLELNRIKGIYVCGELLNVDGDCGGYNLQWAWSSGYTAGINAVREIKSVKNK